MHWLGCGPYAWVHGIRTISQIKMNLVEEPDLKFIANEAIRSVSDLLENFNLFKSDQNEYRMHA